MVGKRFWSAWKAVREGGFRVVVGGPGGVFAPLVPEAIIVDDESSPGYIAQRAPRVSAHNLALSRESASHSLYSPAVRQLPCNTMLFGADFPHISSLRTFHMLSLFHQAVPLKFSLLNNSQ